MNKTLTLTIILALTLITQTALAGAVAEFGKAVFSEIERQLIRDYYREKYRAIDRDRHDGYRDSDYDHDGGDHKKHNQKKKGKGKHSSGPGNPQGLPPGIAKKLARGGSLPLGIAKKNLPADLDSRLPPLRDGYKRMEVDGRVVLVEAASNTIVDIIRRTELLEAGARTERQPRPALKPAPTLAVELPRKDVRDVPKPEKPVVEDKSWWQFWKD